MGQFFLLTGTVFMVFMFPLVSHPLLMGLIILIITFMVAATLGLGGLSSWLSYVLVLILLGGLLVIFIYISLLASNENQTPQSNKIKMFFLSTTSILAGSLVISSSLKVFDSKTNALLKMTHYNNESTDWLNLLYSEQLGGMTIFLVLYLLLTLIVVVAISKNDSSSLRAL
nr:NADH dehydrogenase subunit 6 [Daphnia pulex]BCW03091.1 NADH dehydrogenase subunit 6 [Daphnia pulex]BCW03104.1 NADH dehydrogenase subunit 6 [Daphnia pulex]BCW03117.1 NADH dehydrogenase subunit 6 [Daphnia pulex]BCW03130.1 NADH dehydrogenase subunit 6 [Daphnia pulex]